MARRPARASNRFDSKEALLSGGADVRAVRYQRASQDKKRRGKSVKDQGTVNVAEISRHQWTDARSFTDNHRSASRHARKEREDFERLIEEIQTGKFDVLVVWEISRKERDLAVYVKIRDMCVAVGLYFWLVGGVLYDLRDKNDRMMLGFQAVQAEWMADSIRDNVLRGMAGAAQAGLPHGMTTYGYRRLYDPRTKAFLRQEPDNEPREATGRDGSVTKYTRAGVVREIYRRLSDGESVTKVTISLIDRGVPSPRGKVWVRQHLRRLVLNPAYIGKRVYRGEIIGDGQWPALVDEDIYWAVHRTLTDPARNSWRPGRAKYLLSCLVPCGNCGSPIVVTHQSRHGWRAKLYTCQLRRCASIKMEHLDEYVERILVTWLSRPDVYEELSAGQGDREVAEARAEADRLRVELEEWRRLAENREVTAASFVRVEKSLLHDIAEAEKRAATAGVPPLLRDLVGPDAARKWASRSVEAKREVIRMVADITLMPVGKGVRRVGSDRVRWRWKIGPGLDTATSVSRSTPDMPLAA